MSLALFERRARVDLQRAARLRRMIERRPIFALLAGLSFGLLLGAMSKDE